VHFVISFKRGCLWAFGVSVNCEIYSLSSSFWVLFISTGIVTLPLPSTIVDLLQAPSNITPQYNSIVEAIASLLGYELPVHRPSKVLSHNAVPVAPPSSQKPTPMDTTSSYNMELDEPKPAPVSRSSNSGFLADSDDEDEFDAKIEFGKKT